MNKEDVYINSETFERLKLSANVMSRDSGSTNSGRVKLKIDPLNSETQSELGSSITRTDQSKPNELSSVSTLVQNTPSEIRDEVTSTDGIPKVKPRSGFIRHTPSYDQYHEVRSSDSDVSNDVTNSVNSESERSSYVDVTNPVHSEFKRSSFAEALIGDECGPLHSSEDSSDINVDRIIERVSNIRRTESLEQVLSTLIHDDNDGQIDGNFPDVLLKIRDQEIKLFGILTAINRFKQIMMSTTTVSKESVWNIFYNVDELIDTQRYLVDSIDNMIRQWKHQRPSFSTITEHYISQNRKITEFAKNYTQATKEANAVFEKNETLYRGLQDIKLENEKIELTEILLRPAIWLCHSLQYLEVLLQAVHEKDDKSVIEDAIMIMKGQDLKKISVRPDVNNMKFITSALLIELLPYDVRRLRHILLFSEMIVCAKQKLHSLSCVDEQKSGGRGFSDVISIERFELKWFIPLSQLVIFESKVIESNERRKSDINNLKQQIRDLRMQLVTEKAKLTSDNFSFRKIVVRKEVDKILNQIYRIQTDLLLISPTIAFVIGNNSEKQSSHSLLVSSLKDIEMWKTNIRKAQRDQILLEPLVYTAAAVSSVIDSYKRNESVVETAKDAFRNADGISGVLVTTVNKISGVQPRYSYYVTIEVDSFKLVEIKAKTKCQTGATELVWDETFEIDLDCSRTMAILLHQSTHEGGPEILAGYFECKLHNNEAHNLLTSPMIGNENNKFTLSISSSITAKSQFMKRQPSMKKTGLFGINLASIVSRERQISKQVVSNVPLILSSCIERIEAQGLDEEGIYRIGGSKMDILELQKKFNKNVLNAVNELPKYDLPTVTGIVKTYLRELPEPIMLTKNYESLILYSKLDNDAERYKSYSDLIRQLPEPNRSTVLFLLRHFRKVCEHSDKNQMVPGNLGLIFGMTLMLPPCDSEKDGFSINIATETMNSLTLARIFTQILNGIKDNSINID